VDAYFYSIIFDPIRQYSRGWEQSRWVLWRYFRYMLDCPLCFSHWTAAVILAILSLCGCFCLPITLHPVLAVILIPAVARISLVLRDYSLPPLVNANVPETQPESGNISEDIE
jgi:hypothetical protein